MSNLTIDEKRYLAFLKKFGGRVDKSKMYKTMYNSIGDNFEQTIVRESLMSKGLIGMELEVSVTEGRDPTYIFLT